MRSFIAIALLAAMAGTDPGRPPAQDAPPSQSSPEAAAVIRDLLHAYRSGPVAERIRIRVRHPLPPDATGPALDRTSIVTVRGARTGVAGGPVLRADLGVLAVYSAQGEVVAVRTDDPGICLKRRVPQPLTPEILATVLPPTPMPHLALVFGDDAAGTNLTPYSRGIRWALAPPAGALNGSQRLVGTTASGRTEMEIDAATHRLKRFEFRGASGSVIEIACEPIEPGEPSAWRIDTSDRRPVRNLRDLRVPETTFVPGEPLPTLPLIDLATVPWSLDEEFASRAGAPRGRPPAPIILLLARQRLDADAPGVPGARAAEGVRAFLRRQRRSAAENDSVDARAAIPFWRPVLVFEVEEFTRERLALAAERWNTAEPRTASPFDDAEPECLWSGTGRALVNRFVPGAEVALVVIEPDGTLAGAAGLGAADPSALALTRLEEIFASRSRPGALDAPR